MSPTVSITVTEQKRQEMDAYAHDKGFRTASDLVRYATTQHMRRYPMSTSKRPKRVRAVQPDTTGGAAEATP